VLEVAALWQPTTTWQPPAWLAAEQAGSATAAAPAAAGKPAVLASSGSRNSSYDSGESSSDESGSAAGPQTHQPAANGVASGRNAAAGSPSSDDETSSEESDSDSGGDGHPGRQPQGGGASTDAGDGAAAQQSVGGLFGQLDTLFAAQGAGNATSGGAASLKLNAMRLLQRQPPASQMPSSRQQPRHTLPPQAQRDIGRPGSRSGDSRQVQQANRSRQQTAGRPARSEHQNPITVSGRPCRDFSGAELVCHLPPVFQVSRRTVCRYGFLVKK